MTAWPQRAAAILARAGYSDLSFLDGGVAAWEKAGFVTFSGVHVPSKAFGEFVEHDSGTPNVSAQELDALMKSGTKMVVLDSRPFDEYSRISIPIRHQRARAPSWCCACATSRPRPTPSSWSIAPAAPAASSARSR